MLSIEVVGEEEKEEEKEEEEERKRKRGVRVGGRRPVPGST